MLPVGVLALLLRACAPNVDAATQAALVSVESSGSAFAISDSNTGASYYPTSYEQAVILSERLIRDNAKRYGARDAGIGVGVSQIQSTNFTALHLTPAIVLDPCMNLRVGSLMLLNAYRSQYAIVGGPPDVQHQQKALSRALEVYNSGKPYGVDLYVAKVLLASRTVLGRPAEPPAPKQAKRTAALVSPAHRRRSAPALGTTFYESGGAAQHSSF